jgi:hypothetical protein
LVKWLPDWCDLKPDGTFYRLSDLAMTNPIALKMAHPAELAQLSHLLLRWDESFSLQVKMPLGLREIRPTAPA